MPMSKTKALNLALSYLAASRFIEENLEAALTLERLLSDLEKERDEQEREERATAERAAAAPLWDDAEDAP